VLGFLKSKLPADSFDKVSAAIPGADNMMSRLADTGEQASGVLGAVKGAVGRLFGGGTDGLLAKIGQLGISPDKLSAFISGIVEHLKGKVPENVLSQVRDVFPAPQEVTH
jgi:hypothetical protein